VKKQSIITAVIVAVVLLGGGAGAYYLTQNNTPAASEKTENNAETADKTSDFTFENNVLTFKGKEGVTAEEILKEYPGVVMTGSGEMAYVTSVNDIVPNPDNEYWSFNINDEPSMVGVGSYVTKDGDIMTLQISTF
jgi:hypothetical protein